MMCVVELPVLIADWHRTAISSNVVAW